MNNNDISYLMNLLNNMNKNQLSNTINQLNNYIN